MQMHTFYDPLQKLSEESRIKLPVSLHIGKKKGNTRLYLVDQRELGKSAIAEHAWNNHHPILCWKRPGD